MTEIQRFVHAILEGTIAAPQTGTYQPTLVVGLGGTGIKVLRLLKRYLVQHQLNYVKLLGIDSDQTENLSYVGLMPLSDAEMALIDANAAVGLLERAASKVPNTAHVLTYLPDAYDGRTGVHQEVKGKIQTQRGAGQFRRAGKLLFCANVSGGRNLEAVVRRLRQEMVGLQTTVANRARGVHIQVGTRIFVVSSLAGGQGSGSLLDCLALLRKYFDQPQDQIAGVLVLPGQLYDQQLRNPAAERPQTRGNALGTLRELQAAMQGLLGQHTFVFDAENRYTPGTSPLLNYAYLVDHATFSRLDVATDFELFEAISLFLYALIGCGVGARAEAGAINGPAEHVKDPVVPRLFKAFGIGVLQYPVEDLLEFCLRQSLKKWLDLWVQPPAANVAEREADRLLTNLGINDLDQHQAKIRPDIPEASFFVGADQEKMLLRMSDNEFFAAVDGVRDRIDGDLNRYDGAIDTLRSQLASNVREELQKQALAWAGSGGGLVRECLAQVKSRLAKQSAQHTEQARKRPERFSKLEADMAKKAKWIRRLPGRLDRQAARAYVKLFREWLEEKVQAKLDQYLSQSLTYAMNCVETVASDVENLLRTLRDVGVQNDTALGRLTAPPSKSSFVQLALAGPEFPTWCHRHFVSVPAPLSLSSLDAEHLLNTALVPVMAGYRSHLQKLNLIEALRASRDLRHKLAAVETAAEPLISLTSKAPPLEEMVPQKFVVANLPRPDDDLVQAFTPVGQGEVGVIQTNDPFRLICVQTVHGFGAAHWIGFETADTAYRQDEWRYHVLPEYKALEPLARLAEERAVALRWLGLCLAFQFIHVRGTNYYRNLTWNGGPVNKYAFEFHNAMPNQGARALLYRGLVIMPAASAVRPLRNDPRLLGDSLESALERLTQPQCGQFVQDINELFEDLIAAVGKPRVAQTLRDFVNGELDQLQHVKTREGRRQQILREMAEVLKQYAAELAP